MIVLSQLSRDNVKDPNGKRPPELSDLRGSGALEQDATTVVLLHKVADVIAAWRSDPPLYYLEISGDPRLDNERQHAVAAVSWNLAKNQNGPTGELPFVVFQQCFRWYVGDEDSEKAEMYHRIMADWRFLEEPFVTAEKNNSVVYPDFWPQKCAEACGKLGLDIPSHIRDQLKTWDIDRYNALLREHSGRISDAIETAAIPITKDEAPPSVVKMVEKAASGIVPSVTNGVSSDELDKRMAASPISSNIELTEDARAFSDNFDEVDF